MFAYAGFRRPALVVIPKWLRIACKMEGASAQTQLGMNIEAVECSVLRASSFVQLDG